MNGVNRPVGRPLGVLLATPLTLALVVSEPLRSPSVIHISKEIPRADKGRERPSIFLLLGGQ
jgi:hypothetical protein